MNIHPLITPSCFLIKFQCVGSGGLGYSPRGFQEPLQHQVQPVGVVSITPNFWLSTRAYGEAQEGRVAAPTLVADSRCTHGTLEAQTQKDGHGLPV